MRAKAKFYKFEKVIINMGSEKKRGRIFKKGVSPVVATVLLVVMVIIIGLIIFLWFRSLTEEAVTKFGGRNIALVCDDVQLLASYSGGTFSVSNIGNVPVYSLKLRTTDGRSHTTEDIDEVVEGWPSVGLKQGKIFTEVVTLGGEEIFIIPVLVGTSADGEKTHICEDRHGQELVL